MNFIGQVVKLNRNHIDNGLCVLLGKEQTNGYVYSDNKLAFLSKGELKTEKIYSDLEPIRVKSKRSVTGYKIYYGPFKKNVFPISNSFCIKPPTEEELKKEFAKIKRLQTIAEK